MMKEAEELLGKGELQEAKAQFESAIERCVVWVLRISAVLVCIAQRRREMKRWSCLYLCVGARV